MARKAKGTSFVARGAAYASVIVAPRKRLARTLAGIVEPEDTAGAQAWAVVLQELVGALRESGRSSEIEDKIATALQVGRDDPADGLARVRAGIGKLRAARGEARITAPAASKGPTTFQTFAKRWTSGELHRLDPDLVKDVAHDKNMSRLQTYVYPVIGDRPLNEITIEHAKDVLRRVPREKSRETRRHVAQLMTRILNLAVFPGGLLPISPLPRGFLPKLGPRKAFSYLYPTEDAALLACADVPLINRVLYGFLCREGMRSSEALALTWGDLDLRHGAVQLDENKTDDARAWALDKGVLAALKLWQVRVPHKPTDAVFAGIQNPGHLADSFRDHLRLAGVDRPELFKSSKARRQIRLHDCRATFVTLALANGKTEGWVTDRTGHKSSGQIATYKRSARLVKELRLGPLTSLDRAIPELRKRRAKHAA